MFDHVISDCPRCSGVRTVFFGVCSVCFAEFDEWHAIDEGLEAPQPATA